MPVFLRSDSKVFKNCLCLSLASLKVIFKRDQSVSDSTERIPPYYSVRDKGLLKINVSQSRKNFSLRLSHVPRSSVKPKAYSRRGTHFVGLLETSSWEYCTSKSLLENISNACTNSIYISSSDIFP